MQLREEQDETTVDPEKTVSTGLPLTFYIRSARLCLKKASLARLSGEESSEELQHLRRFESLVACVLPVHKEYSERRGDKAVRELHVGLVETRRRIQELLEAGEGLVSPSAGPESPARSPATKDMSPKRDTSPQKKVSSPTAQRPVSRPKAALAEKKVLPRSTAKSPLVRTPPLRKIRTTPNKRPESPKRVRSPSRNNRSGWLKAGSGAGGSPKKRQTSPPGKRRTEDEGAYYLPKKLPHKKGSVDSRFETPSRYRNSEGRDSGMLRDIKSQRTGEPLDFRKSYDDLPSYEDVQEVCVRSETSHRNGRKSAGVRSVLGTGRADKVWNNMVYEKTRASPALGRFDASEVRVEVRKELKKSLEGLKNRFEEEGKKWRGRVSAVEKEIEGLRDDSENGLAVIRKTVHEDAKKRDSSFKKLEGGLLTEIEALRTEVAKKGDRTWMESAIKEAVAKCFVDRSEADERPLQEELRLLRSEVETLNSKRGELQEHLEELFQIMENDRESMGTEQGNIRSQNEYLKKQLQSIKKEELHALIEMDEFKKGCDADLDELKQAISRLKNETADMKLGLQGLEDNIRTERLASRRSSRDETSSAEKMMIMDRVENLSKLYLGGLDEVRMDILDIKNKCQDKLEELEDQLMDFKQRHENFPSSRLISRELESRIRHLENKQEEDVRLTLSNVDAKYREIESQLKDLKQRPGDNLDARIAELEQKQESLQASKFLVEDAVAAAENERRAAASAASEASVAASKASSSLKELLNCLESDMRNKSRKNGRLQEDGSTPSRLSCETDATLASAVEAKRRAEDLQEELRSVVTQVEKQREAAAQAAAKASSFATESEDLLAEMAVMRRKVQLETDGDTGSRTSTKELERRLEALEKSNKSIPDRSSSTTTSRPISRGRSTMSTTKKKQGEEDDMVKIDTRIGSLENHLEHVASATYTNLRILDTKVDHVSMSAQTALEGASIAENKCGALGAELVKVFRVLASFKKEEMEDRSMSPERRPNFACDSCKKVVTILNKSLESLPSESTPTRSSTKREEVRRISVRVEGEKNEKLGRDIGGSEKNESGTPQAKLTGVVRRSWGTGMPVLAEQRDIDEHSWGVR